MFVIVLYEGLLGGACYVNAFYRISQEVISSLIVLCSVYASLCVHLMHLIMMALSVRVIRDTRELELVYEIKWPCVNSGHASS